MHIDNGTDVTFINEYIQIILRNLDSIVKNNFLLEAKNVIMEKSLVEKNNVGVINLQLTENLNELREKLAQVELNNNNSHNQYVENILAEKQRIQDGLNVEMSAHANLRSRFNQLQSDHDQVQSNYNVLQQEKVQLIDEVNSLKINLDPKKSAIDKKNNGSIKPLAPKINKVSVVNSKSGGTF